jgi:hypothetical protein
LIGGWTHPVVGAAALGGLLKPCYDAELAAHLVSTHVNRPANNDPLFMAALDE